MNAQAPTPAQHISPNPFSERYDLPHRPDDTRPAVQDAYRQTQFLLGRDLDLSGRLRNLQLRIVRESSHSQHRSRPHAALVGLWSRAFLLSRRRLHHDDSRRLRPEQDASS